MKSAQFSLFSRSLVMISIISLLLSGQAVAGIAAQPINGVIGDASFIARFGASPDENTDENLRILTHLVYVEKLLRSQDVHHLPAELRLARARNLDRLHDYLMLGRFPRNYDHQVRRPCFIDRDGAICAVGYLVEQSEGRAAAETINGAYKYSNIIDMRSALLERWLACSGLTIEEAAMIQPTYHNDRPMQLPLSPRESYEPSDRVKLGLRGIVLGMEIKQQAMHSTIMFFDQGSIARSTIVRKPAKGRSDTEYFESYFSPTDVYTQLTTSHSGKDTIFRETIGYNPQPNPFINPHPYTFTFPGRAHVLHERIHSNRTFLDSARYYFYDDAGRPVKILTVYPGNIGGRDKSIYRDTLIWNISYDTLDRDEYPIAWMNPPLIPVVVNGVVLFQPDTAAKDDNGDDGIRIRERWSMNRYPGAEDVVVVDSLGRRVLYRPSPLLHQGSLRFVMYDYDELGNLTHELTMEIRSEEDFVRGIGAPIHDITSRYVFDARKNWIRRERTTLNLNGEKLGHAVDTTERTIKYY